MKPFYYLKIIFHECVYPVFVVYLDYLFVQDNFGPGTGCNHKYTRPTYLGIIFSHFSMKEK